MVEVQCTIRGKVQNVGFRDFVQTQAANCELTGWVKNNEDGTVSVRAQGMPEHLKRFIEELHEGSVLSQVTDVAVQWQAVGELFSDFSVIHS